MAKKVRIAKLNRNNNHKHSEKRKHFSEKLQARLDAKK